MHEDASTFTNIDRFAVDSVLIYGASDVLLNTFAPHIRVFDPASVTLRPCPRPRMVGAKRRPLSSKKSGFTTAAMPCGWRQSKW